MKLVSTLPERGGFLHAVPLFDLFALLLVFILLGPSFVRYSGIRVEMPMSRYHVERDPGAKVITLTEGSPAAIWLGREPIGLGELVDRLKAERMEADRVPTLYIRSDGAIPAAFERTVAETALDEGFRVYMLGQDRRQLGVEDR